MIKVMSLQNTDNDPNTYLISAFADTKEEVTPTAKFIGLPEGGRIEFGSKVLTAKGDLGYMQSDGTWNFL